MLKLKHERGAAAILVAGSLVLLMGMAAIAIDYGSSLNERRQDQTGADFAVLSGALEIALGSSTQVAVDEILELVDANVRTQDVSNPLSNVWTACTDSNALPVTADDLGLTPATECISFNTFNHIRVRIPDQLIDTSFARAIGATTMSTFASAESESSLFPTEGNPPPFAVLSGASGGSVVCLRTSSSGNPPAQMEGAGPGNPAIRGTTPDPCDAIEYDVDTEMFGLLDPNSYFDGDGTIACRKNSNDYFIAAGIDHTISSFIQKTGSPFSGSGEIEDGTGCTGNPKNPVNGPNTIPVKSGLTDGELRCGMISAMAGTCSTTVPGPPSSGLSSDARLHQGDYVQSTYTFLGERMDNSALWDFFTRDDASGDIVFDDAPASCTDLATALNAGDATWDFFDKRDTLIDCLVDWTAGNYEPIFAEGIWSTSRFAFVPLVHEQSLESGDPDGPTTCPVSNQPNCVHVDDFVPTWYQTLYTRSTVSCTDAVSAPGNTWGLHHAGQQNSCGTSSANLVRLSAIVLDCGMLPPGGCDSRPGIPSPGGDLIPTIRLTK